MAAICLAGLVGYVALSGTLFALRPHYSVLHHAESDYGNGPYSWIMDINFAVRFLLAGAGAVALWRGSILHATGKVGVGLLGLWAFASGVLALFRDDLQGAVVTTTHGEVHLVAAAVAFISCLIGTLLLTVDLRHDPGMKPLVPALSIVWTIALVGLVRLDMVGFAVHTLGGLWERTFIFAELIWIAVVTARLSRQPAPAPVRATASE